MNSTIRWVVLILVIQFKAHCPHFHDHPWGPLPDTNRKIQPCAVCTRCKNRPYVSCSLFPTTTPSFRLWWQRAMAGVDPWTPAPCESAMKAGRHPPPPPNWSRRGVRVRIATVVPWPRGWWVSAQVLPVHARPTGVQSDQRRHRAPPTRPVDVKINLQIQCISLSLHTPLPLCIIRRSSSAIGFELMGISISIIIIIGRRQRFVGPSGTRYIEAGGGGGGLGLAVWRVRIQWRKIAENCDKLRTSTAPPPPDEGLEEKI